jgi:DNA-dependent RNA polymerase auxiliary subunit epsilon
MAKYKLKHKEEAMKLYLEGNSFTDVAVILQERNKFVPPLSRETVRGWSDAMGWQELMSDVKQEVRQEVKKQVVKDKVSRLEQVEEVRGAFLERMREKQGADIRGHEFAKLTEMAEKMSLRENEKQELVETINDCISQALEEVKMDENVKQQFLLRYIEKLRNASSYI